MSLEEDPKVNVMQGLKNVLSKMELAVAKRSKDLPQIAPKLVAVSKIKPASLILEAYQTGQRDFGENYVNELAAKKVKDLPQIAPKLVAVSKIKPAALILEAYQTGQRDFGENYVNELAAKANDPIILENCKDIKWHLIGPLQTNKINKVLSVPRLHMIQTVHSEKLADNLNKRWGKYRKEEVKLAIMVQVNTSGEEAKSGIEPENASKLVEHVIKNCQYLDFKGLMTIGEYDYDVSRGPNPDFISLAKVRQEVCQNLNLDINQVELSMGMSTDYEHAIEMGATTIRVGSTIFGLRLQKNQDIESE